MDILRNTSIDFMKYRKFWISVSFLTDRDRRLRLFFHGKLNVGIDFAGGTQLTLKFQRAPGHRGPTRPGWRGRYPRRRRSSASAARTTTR